jgi:pectin methylesterase-like acyl-CoA thioesterase
MKEINNHYLPRLSLIIIISVFFVTIKNPEASTIHVPKDYPSIQTALDNAQKSDMIKVAAGLYKENIIWPETAGISLIGRQKDTIIDGENLSHVIKIKLI